MKKIHLRHFLLLALMMLTAHLGWSQGATTAAMSGVITDKDGAGLPGATVIAVHTPTNTQYGTATNSEGRFNIQNMRVGGPYTVKVTFVGYADVTRNDITLGLGQNQRLDVALTSATTELGGVEITGARDQVINSSRTGAETSVQREQIERLPTLNRELKDFIRLSPQANGGGSSSIGGSNNRYNNITIDGAVNNDVFGLSGTGTPGGSAGTTPIALDAIQEIQVVVAPYDVTLGNFTGGGVNAVTRSGANDLSASIYGFGRNQNSIGKSVTEPFDKAAEFFNYQTGFRVGGAVVKDKVFFFLNAEIARRSEPLAFEPGDATSRFSTTVLQDLSDFTKANLGYDVGSFGVINRKTESNKIFARLDFNLSDHHQLTLRHNFVDAFDDNITRTSSSIRFSNNAYKFSNVTNSSVAELNSTFGSVSNKLLLSYTRIRDSRDTPGALFPHIEIRDAGNIYAFGTERSSAANQLDQDIIELTDNVIKTLGKHTITVGTHNELFKFRNLFLNNGNGYYQFNSIADFKRFETVNGVSVYSPRANRLQASYATADNGEAKFSAMQLGFYAQDQYSPMESLRLTLGVRLDVPLFLDKPALNPGVTETFGSNISTQNTPNGQLLWAPRVGFNWDVDNDTKIQVRGGTGIFTGRVPFVWISNSYTNSGMIQGGVDAGPLGTAPNVVYPPLLTDPSQIPTRFTAAPYSPVATTQINVLGKDFKLPQVWRTNLAVDFRLPGDIVATVEGIYSKTINDIYYKDINLKDPIGRLAGPDQRPIYAAATATRRVNTKYTNVYLLDNTSKGYRYNGTVQLQKRFRNGLNTTAAYTYGMAKEVNSGSSSTASSNFGFNQILFNPNDPELAYSRNDQRHRVLASAGYTFKYAGDKAATSISFVYEGLSGQPLTYLYGQGSDLNNDGSTGNDLLYIPRDVRDSREIILVPTVPAAGGAPDTRSVATIQDQLDAFINNDPYLSSHRGQYVERFAARLPWTHQIDMRIAQTFYFQAGGKRNSLEVSFDVINVGNLLNREWGNQYTVLNNAIELLKVESKAAGQQPTFSFPTSFTTTNRSYDIAPFASRWQGQLGVRYTFN
jgi:hypothetical protein